MSLEASLQQLVHTTVDATERYFKRLHFLANLLDQIYPPLANQHVPSIRVDEQQYDLDDLLVLLFEFVQLITTFSQFEYAAASLNQFLAVHGKRLEQLHVQGRLDHLRELVEFRLQTQQATDS